MAKRKASCRKPHCEEPPFLGGLCKRHDDEDMARRLRRDTATKALQTGLIDGELVNSGPLRDEFDRLQNLWRQICDAVNSGREHALLRAETEYGVHWCIEIAQEIIDAERDRRTGKEGDTEMRKYIRQQVWERLENLERGVMSNGVPRNP